MRTKSLILLVLALGCGLVASIGISQVIQAQRQNAGPAIETEQIVVALKEIKPGGKITPDMIELGNWDKTRIPEGAMRSIEQVINYKFPLKTIVVKGEPLLESKFQSKDVNVATNIPKGYVLTAIPADATIAVGNLLQPGDRVNISWSIKGLNGTNTSFSKTILHNIEVFAVNSTWSGTNAQTGDKKEESAIRNVGLLVTDEQSNVLALCQEYGGKLKLSLRPPGAPSDEQPNANAADITKLVTTGPTSGNEEAEKKGREETEKYSRGGGFLEGVKELLKNGAANMPKTQVAAEPSDLETHTIEIIEGSTIRNLEIQRSKDTKGRWVQKETTGSKASGSAVNSVGTDPSAGLPTFEPDKSSTSQSTQDIIKSLNSGL